MFSNEAIHCMECVTKHDPRMRYLRPDGHPVDGDASTMTAPARSDAWIIDPGKFESEPLSTYHAYHVMLDGGADEDHGRAWLIGNMICEETESGFVGADVYASDEEAIAVWERLDAIDYIEQYA